MAKQRYINTKFWEDAYVSNLDPSEKLIFLYLLTNSATSICGMYEIPVKRIAVDTGYDRDMVVKILDRFARDKKITYCDGWIVISNFVKHQNTGNPKIIKGIETELSRVPVHIKELRYVIDSLSHSNSNYNYNSNTNTNIIESEEETAEPRTRFKKPTVDDIKKYVAEKGFAVDAGRFFDYYESKGWVVGKSPMKSWTAAVNSWDRNERKNKTTTISTSDFMKMSPEQQAEARKNAQK